MSNANILYDGTKVLAPFGIRFFRIRATSKQAVDSTPDFENPTIGFLKFDLESAAKPLRMDFECIDVWDP